MTERAEPTRLFLVTPARIDAADFAPLLRQALAAGDVAAVLIAADREIEATAAALVPIVQEAGAAALVPGDTRLAGHVGADGVQIDTGTDDLRLALQSFRQKRIVGAGNLSSRHVAMQAGEAGADYLFFGRPHGDTHDAPHPKALELAEWWSDLMEIPAVAMAGSALESIGEAAATGAAFVAAGRAVWMHAAGPGEAVRAANAILAADGRVAA